MSLSFVFIVVGCWTPKAIPHFLRAPYGSEAYVHDLFKASQYINVHKNPGYTRTLANQSAYSFELPTIGNDRISGIS